MISVGGRGHIWGVMYAMFKQAGSIWSWDESNSGPNKWQARPETMSWISAGDDGTVWAIGSDRKPRVWNGNSWDVVAGELDVISVGSRAHVIGLNRGELTGISSVWRWNDHDRTWSEFSPAAVTPRLVAVDVASDGTVWGIAEPRMTLRWNNGRWEQQTVALWSLSVRNKGEVWGTRYKIGDVVRLIE
jgi:hypothetical protein